MREQHLRGGTRQQIDIGHVDIVAAWAADGHHGQALLKQLCQLGVAGLRLYDQGAVDVEQVQRSLAGLVGRNERHDQAALKRR